MRFKTHHGEFDPGSEGTLAACITHASRTMKHSSECGRVANGWGTRKNLPLGRGQLLETKANTRYAVEWKNFAEGWSCVWLASWCGNGAPRRRSVAGLRGWTATLELRHGPNSYGRQQWGIFRNGRKSDGATLREGWRPAGCKLLFSKKNKWRYSRNKHRLTLCQQPR